MTVLIKVTVQIGGITSGGTTYVRLCQISLYQFVPEAFEVFLATGNFAAFHFPLVSTGHPTPDIAPLQAEICKGDRTD